MLSAFKSLDNIKMGGQDRVAVKHPLRKDKDVGANPAATRKTKNKNWTLGRPPAQKVPKWSTRSGGPVIQS